MGSMSRQIDLNFWAGKKVLVTGHTGFKGSWLTFWLEKMGASVCGVSLDPSTHPSLWDELKPHLKADDVRGDIRGGSWKEFVANFRPEIVFHLAAQPLVVSGWEDPLLTYDTNVIGTANLLQELNRLESVKVILVVTTDKVYLLDGLKTSRDENSPLGGKDPYAVSKVCVELMVASWPISENIRIATARSGNVIGGGDWARDRLLPDIVRAAFSDELLDVRLPHAIRPWQHVLEPLYGYLLMAESLFTGQNEIRKMNFGPSIENQVSVQEIINFCISHFSYDYSLKTSIKSESYLESDYLMLNSEYARQELNWSPVLEWKKSIALTLDWYLGFKSGKTAVELLNRDIEYFLRQLA